MTKLINLLELITRCLSGFCLAMVLALITAQIISRFLFNFPLAAASELSIYAMIWCVFLASAVAFRRNEHIAVEVVRGWMPIIIQRLLKVVVFIAVTLFLIIVIVKGYELSTRAMRQISTAASLPVGYISMAMPICSLLALIFLTENAYNQLKEHRRP